MFACDRVNTHCHPFRQFVVERSPIPFWLPDLDGHCSQGDNRHSADGVLNAGGDCFASAAGGAGFWGFGHPLFSLIIHFYSTAPKRVSPLCTNAFLILSNVTAHCTT